IRFPELPEGFGTLTCACSEWAGSFRPNAWSSFGLFPSGQPGTIISINAARRGDTGLRAAAWLIFSSFMAISWSSINLRVISDCSTVGPVQIDSHGNESAIYGGNTAERAVKLRQKRWLQLQIPRRSAPRDAHSLHR